MTTALWCILAATMLPYLLAGLSKVGRPYDNARPRESGHGGWQRRADWAQANAWEAFAPFAAAVLVAHYARAPQPTVDMLALGFIAFRIGHAAAYLGNKPSLRSALWLGGFVCVVGLFVVAARA
jgi:uncharacterized MAPEG superfamily protein